MISTFNKRISNIELLRIIAMILIVLAHIPCSGKALTVNHAVRNFFFVGSKFGVNVFVIIGASFLINKRFSIYRVCRLVCEVTFYALIGIIFHLAIYRELNYINVIQSFKYWFPFAYIFMLFLSEKMNQLDVNSCKNISLFGLLFSALLTGFFLLNHNNPGIVEKIVDNGFLVGPFWFCYIYIFMRWLSGSIINKFHYKTWLFLFITTYIFMYILVLNSFDWIRGMISPICLLSAYSLYNVFKCFDSFSSNIVNKVASSTFAVYLFHHNKLMSEFIWNNIFRMNYLSENTNLWGVVALCSVILIFIVTLILEYIRKNLALSTKKLDLLFANKIDCILCK